MCDSSVIFSGSISLCRSVPSAIAASLRASSTECCTVSPSLKHDSTAQSATIETFPSTSTNFKTWNFCKPSILPKIFLGASGSAGGASPSAGGASPSFGASPSAGASPSFGGSPSAGASPSFGGSPSAGGGGVGSFGGGGGVGSLGGGGSSEGTCPANIAS